jgi:hypothetical protein
MENDELIRWRATTFYCTEKGTQDVHHDLEEIVDLHDLGELGVATVRALYGTPFTILHRVIGCRSPRAGFGLAQCARGPPTQGHMPLQLSATRNFVQLERNLTMSNSDATSNSHDGKDENIEGRSEMTFDEMARIVDEARNSEYRKWCAQAQALVQQLQRHLPADVFRELEEFVCSQARDCLHEVLERDLLTTMRREAERWGWLEPSPADRFGLVDRRMSSGSIPK